MRLPFLQLFRCACFPQRYVLAVFILLGLVVCYLMRICVNLALNEMTFKLSAPTILEDGNVTSSKHQFCPAEPTLVNKTNTRAEFHWDQHIQHDIIKSVYVGYVVAHVPAGMLADKFGGKHVFGAGVLVSALLSLCSPALARISPYAFMAGRVLQGFGQGVMFPSSSSMLAKWAPPNERSTMTGIVQSGVMFGNVIGYISSGMILSMFPGWEPIYYVCGVIGLLWCIGWYSLCYSSPADHPFITDSERDMIENQLALNTKQKPKHIPWKSIFTSGPFLSVILINFSHAWALFTMVNEMPAYMGKVLNFNIKSSGLFSALPHLATIPTSIGIGFLCDFLIRRKVMSVTTNRKIFAFLSNVLPIPFMLLASFAGCDRTNVIIFFMCMMFFKGFAYATCRANPVDLSPNYAGVLMGIMNGSGALAGMISPMFVPLFITGDGSIEEWRNMFYLSAIVMFMFSVPFLFFGSGEQQVWNNALPTKSNQQLETEQSQETKT